MEKEIKELIYRLSITFTKKDNSYIYFCHSNWTKIFWNEFYKDKLKSKLGEYMNTDYLELRSYEFELDKSLFINKLNSYLENKNINLKTNIEYEGWYFASIFLINSLSNDILTSIWISGLLKYYHIFDRKNKDINNIIIKFLKENWYQELTQELWETELDIIWWDFMPYEDWLIKWEKTYKEDYIAEDVYYIPEMDVNVIKRDRKKDFEAFCEWAYEWPYKVKHLLFWESFIGEFK